VREGGGVLTRRLVQLFAGLVLYGVSLALLVEAGLGLDPWDVFHQGLSRRLDWSLGAVVAVVGAVVLLLWLPLRQRPGFGTVCNVIVVAISVDLALAVLPEVHGLALRLLALALGIGLNAVATAAYLGAGFGAGPRDGLMTGLVGRTGGSVRVVRTGIEVTVLVVGWVLGGDVGIGTAAYALAIGPLVHPLMPLLACGPPPARPSAVVG
jgi:uncharacterized membrane protein YczE